MSFMHGFMLGRMGVVGPYRHLRFGSVDEL
jgi:hypothetical protein